MICPRSVARSAASAARRSAATYRPASPLATRSYKPRAPWPSSTAMSATRLGDGVSEDMASSLISQSDDVPPRWCALDRGGREQTGDHGRLDAPAVEGAA